MSHTLIPPPSLSRVSAAPGASGGLAQILPVSLTFHTSRRNSCTSFYSTPRDSRDLCNTGPPDFTLLFRESGYLQRSRRLSPVFSKFPSPLGSSMRAPAPSPHTFGWVAFARATSSPPSGSRPIPVLRQHEGIVAIATHLWWVAFARVTSSRTSGSGLIRRVQQYEDTAPPSLTRGRGAFAQAT